MTIETQIKAQIAGWDHENITELRNMLCRWDQLRRAMRAEGEDVVEIDMSSLPTEPVPEDVATYPVWAMDRHGRCLTGETADEVRSLASIRAWIDWRAGRRNTTAVDEDEALNGRR